MKSDYKTWLKKELDKAIKDESNSDANYQETGNPRYASARDKAAYAQKAFCSALKVENGGDENLERTRRVISGLKNSAENYFATLPAEEALQKTIEDLSIATLFARR